MGKAKKTRKFAEVKRMLNPKTVTGGVQKKSETKEVVKHVYVVFSARARSRVCVWVWVYRSVCQRPGCTRTTVI